MAFSDPITITIDGNAEVFNKIGAVGAQGTRYATSDREYELLILQQEKKRNRTTIRINRTITATDPYDSDRTVPVTSSVYLVIDTDSMFRSTEDVKQKNTSLGMFNWLSAGSAAALTKAIAGEN